MYVIEIYNPDGSRNATIGLFPFGTAADTWATSNVIPPLTYKKRFITPADRWEP